MSASYAPIPEGAEATPALFNDRFAALLEGDVFNALRYGSAGVASVRSALAAVAASGSGIVYLPPGVWSIDTKDALGRAFDLTSLRSITFRGAGPATVLRLADGLNSIDVMRATGTLQSLTIEDLTYDGNGSGNTTASRNSTFNLLVQPAARNVIIRNVVFRNVTGEGAIRLGGEGDSSAVSAVIIDGCVFDTCGDTIAGCASLDDHSTVWVNGLDVTVTNNLFTQPSISTAATAVEIHGSNNVVENNRFRGYNIDILPGAIFDNHLTSTYGDNVHESCREAYRVYSSSSFTLDLTITGDTISQGDDSGPCIELGFCSTPARFIRINNVSLANSQSSPSGDDGHGIALGRAEHVVIDGCTFTNLAGRAVSASGNSAWEADELAVTIRNCDAIDCGRSSATVGTPSLRNPFAFFSTQTLREVHIENCKLANSAASYMNALVEGNAPADRLLFIDNDTNGVGDIIWSSSAAVGFAKVRHVGSGAPDVWASPGCGEWTNRSDFSVYVARGSATTTSGWSRVE